MFTAGMLSLIWHHREKPSQEQTAALDASHPEVTLSCFNALRGQSAEQERRGTEKGWGGVHPKRHQKSKARPRRWRCPGLLRIGEGADYC